LRTRLLISSAGLAWLVLLSGCGSGERRQALSGVVTYDGQPVTGSIAFMPEGEESAKMRRPGALIEDGKYSIVAQKGALPGKYRVDIRWPKKTGKKVPIDASGDLTDETREGLPEKFNRKSALVVDILPDTSTLDFDLKSK
jgi:hypothetical protein